MKTAKKKKTTAMQRSAPRRRTAVTRARRTAGRAVSRIKVEAEREKELIGTAVGAAVIGFVEGKIPASKLPPILRQLGLPLTIGGVAYLLRRFGVGGQQMKKLLYAAAVGGFSIAAYGAGRKFAMPAGVAVSGVMDDVGRGLDDNDLPGIINGLIDED